MCEVVQLKAADVKKAYEKGDETRKKFLAELIPDMFGDIFQRIKTFDDVCREAGKDPKNYVVTANMDEDEKGGIYFRRCALITKVFNQGWVPDWSNGSQQKWYMWLKYQGPSGFGLSGAHSFYDRSNSDVGSRLVFKDRKTCEAVLEVFIEEWNNLFTIQS
jgi:hypothetical protein